MRINWKNIAKILALIMVLSVAINGLCQWAFGAAFSAAISILTSFIVGVIGAQIAGLIWPPFE